MRTAMVSAARMRTFVLFAVEATPSPVKVEERVIKILGLRIAPALVDGEITVQLLVVGIRAHGHAAIVRFNLGVV